MADDYNPSSGWFTEAPGGDLSLDQLFPDPNADGPTNPSQPSAPSTQPPEQLFLKTATGTVYRTPEDAVSGIEHKDNLINELREFAIAKTGYDPVTKKQVRQPEPSRPEPTQSSPNQPVVYSQNPKQYWDDQVAAAQKGDYDAYLRIQAQLMNEQFAPYAPIVATFARTSAIEQVSNQYPEFRKFYGSDQYTKTLNAIPLLKQAIEAAESNLQASQQLDNLYKTAYLAAQGLRLSEVSDAPPPRVDGNPAPPHSTLSSGQIPPPNPEPRQAFDPSTREGRSQQRQEIMRDQIAKGVLDLKF